MLRDLVSRFVADRYAGDGRISYRAAPEGYSTANWALLAELGLLAMPVGEAAGGLGGGRVEMVTVLEELGRGLVAEPYLADLFLAARLIETAGTPEQIEAWLPQIVAGEARVALAHFEHRARHAELNVGCEARDGRLFGDKTFVQAAEGAKAFVVSARGRGDDDVSLWLVRADDPTLDRRCYRLVDGSIGCELILRGVAGQRMAGGEDALLAVFDDARIAACAEMVGIMAMLFELTLEHVRTRRQFGRAIGDFQAVQHRMADLYVLLEQARSQMLRAALTQEDDGRAAIAGAKSLVSAHAVRLGEECIQFHGGMGVTDELAIGHGHKRILLLATLLGDSESELARYAALVGPG